MGSKLNSVDVCDYMCVCFRKIVEIWNNIVCEKMLLNLAFFLIPA